MFNYDDGLLAGKIWQKYMTALEENIRLEAQLEVAKVTVARLQEAMAHEAANDNYDLESDDN